MVPHRFLEEHVERTISTCAESFSGIRESLVEEGVGPLSIDRMSFAAEGEADAVLVVLGVQLRNQAVELRVLKVRKVRPCHVASKVKVEQEEAYRNPTAFGILRFGEDVEVGWDVEHLIAEHVLTMRHGMILGKSHLLNDCKLVLVGSRSQTGEVQCKAMAGQCEHHESEEEDSLVGHRDGCEFREVSKVVLGLRRRENLEEGRS